MRFRDGAAAHYFLIFKGFLEEIVGVVSELALWVI